VLEQFAALQVEFECPEANPGRWWAWLHDFENLTQC
jgi:hypothetical protein